MNHLTDAQARAVHTLDSDLAISAGAGSGKTRVLAHRFAYACEAGLDGSALSPDEILTITFTTKAAAEISERIRRVLLDRGLIDQSRAIEGAWISTIHGLCARLLRRHSLEAGLSPQFRVADEVMSGLLRHEAWESAVVRFLESEPSAQAIFSEFGTRELRTATFSVHAQLAAMGLSVSRLEFATHSIEAAMKTVAARFDELAQAIGLLKETPARTASIGRLQAFADALRAADEAVARELLSARKPWRDDKEQGVDGGEAVRAMKWLSACLAERDHAWVGESFRALLGEFEGQYKAIKREQDVLDFDDLQVQTAALLSDEDLARAYRGRFRLLMIDEFQDTNDLQMEVVRPLRNDNLCIVGDDKQSIYGWRYADVSIFRRMREQAAAQETLDANFRTHPEIVAFTNALFSSQEFWPDYMRLDARRESPMVVPWDDDRPRTEILCVDTQGLPASEGVRAEATAVADRIAALVDEGVAPGDIAVLMRSGTYAAVFGAALAERGIAAIQGAGGAFFDACEVGDMRALLRLLAQPSDDAALARVLLSDVVGLSPDTLARIRAAAPHGSLWDGCSALLSEDEPPQESTLAWTIRTLETLRARSWRTSLAQQIRDCVDLFDIDLTLLARGSEGQVAWANVQKLIRLAAEFERSHPGDALAFERYLELRDEHTSQEAMGVIPVRACSSVRIMTIHAAKGLEFPVVFVPDLGRGLNVDPRGAFLVGRRDEDTAMLGYRAPTDQGSTDTATRAVLCDQQTAAAIEEEKRVLYVACTRAGEVLVLSGTTQVSESRLSWVLGALDGSETGAIRHIDQARVGVRWIGASADEPPVGTEPVPPAELLEECRCEAVEVLRDSEGLPMPGSVSYSSLKQYSACGRRFYIEQVVGLRTGLLERDSRATVFGSAVHLALQRARDAGSASEVVRSVASAYDLTAEERVRCTDAVAAYFETDTARRVAAAERVEREVPFDLPMGPIRLVGSIDLLAWEGGDALVVDYKTGRSKVGPEQLSAYRDQAGVYALAALAAGAEKVTARFLRLECGDEVHEFAFDRADAEDIRRGIMRSVERMAAGEFEPRAVYDHFTCAECPALHALCDIGGA